MRNPTPVSSLRKALTLTGTLLLAAGCYSAVTQAQDLPDLEGIWSGDRVAGPGVRPRSEARTTAAGRALQEEFELLDDPAIRCIPNGLTRQAGNPYPMEIIRYDDRLTFRYEEWETTRTVYTDGRAHPDDLELSRLGHSIGWYEGQTLVVETVGIEPHLVNNRTGLFASEELTVTERYTRMNDDRFDVIIQFEMTMVDPIMLEEPYVVEKAWSWAPDLDLLTYDCILRERPAGTSR